ncbi:MULTISPECIES: DAPG hydrolase family protein [Clostridium]|uniref:Phloretin hydrolase n=1 Tax=Clostridium butyricum TaxID=1492 RepID=A0AAP9RJ82_CLOBU|nr:MULTISPECIES: hypothetical protein [Clostridium]MBZ5748144.1 phloretin hydrolase [Clostridium butyricum]MDU1603104.1 phloretin hydrolase [Clostridium sp.]MDU6038856.1 phloretin hydrolase [Clostridium butyricum]QMW92871.1 phloretin hydrolase [Clostridium butyricum]BBK78947.1 hypothetical protein Cbu04g_39550 [Clostridium butyricum]
MTKVELTREEKELSYVKYFYEDLAAVPEEKTAIGNGEACDPKKALNIKDRNVFLKGEDTGIQAGFTVMEDGVGYVANTTFMKDVTVEMMQWWFAWHSVNSDLRYKMWDNEDHYYARADKPEYVLDKNVPLSEKTWGVNHTIKEDIGLGAEYLVLSFRCPSDFGYDMDILGSEKCEGMVCAIGIGNVPAFMTHKFYNVEGGMMFESRFWIGYKFENGEFIKIIPEGKSVPEIVPRSLFKHNIKEFTNLASILPRVYAEEKNNW